MNSQGGQSISTRIELLVDRSDTIPLCSLILFSLDTGVIANHNSLAASLKSGFCH